MTDIPQITPPPLPPPQRGQDPEVFIPRSDSHVDWVHNTFVPELNEFAPAVIDATTERVVNEAGVSFQGAAAARDAAIAARDTAQNYAASINPASFVNRTADQNIDGVKTFAQKIIASLGIRINGQDLTAVTAAGKALLEAADVAAQKSILGVGAVEAVGAVGALVTAASNALAANSSIALGTTVAGSSLVVSSQLPRSLGGYFTNNTNYPQPGVIPPGTSLGLSGTWRLQTAISTVGSGDPLPVGLWKRIA